MAIRAIAVEDDEAVSRLIAQVLTSHGFEVCGTAATGEDGVALARRERPDVALVDLGLPKMSGEDVIATIRHEPPRPPASRSPRWTSRRASSPRCAPAPRATS